MQQQVNSARAGGQASYPPSELKLCYVHAFNNVKSTQPLPTNEAKAETLQ